MRGEVRPHELRQERVKGLAKSFVASLVVPGVEVPATQTDVCLVTCVVGLFGIVERGFRVVKAPTLKLPSASSGTAREHNAMVRKPSGG